MQLHRQERVCVLTSTIVFEMAKKHIFGTSTKVSHSTSGLNSQKSKEFDCKIIYYIYFINVSFVLFVSKTITIFPYFLLQTNMWLCFPHNKKSIWLAYISTVSTSVTQLWMDVQYLLQLCLGPQEYTKYIISNIKYIEKIYFYPT